MPRFDKTGPQGLGPRTGRGFGWCPPAYGFGRGFGRGWAWPSFGWPFYQPTKKEEKEMLSEEMKVLREEIKEIERRLEELKK
jgi:hypothetical protein